MKDRYETKEQLFNELYELRQRVAELETIEAEHWKLKETLREREKRFQTLTKMLPVGMFRTDARGNYIFVNEQWCKIAGLTPEEAHGESWASVLHPQDREKVLKEWQRAVRENLPFELECRFQRPDGGTTWVFGQAVAEKGDWGKVEGYVGTITDIATRRRIEEVLERSEAKYYSLVEQAGAGIVIIDAEGNLTFVNRAFFQMIGYPTTELLGQPFARFLHPEDVERIRTQLLKDFERPSERHLEYRLLHQDGRVIYCYSNPAPILHQGQFIGVSAIVHDITERKQTEEQLRKHRDHLEELVQEHTVELQKEIEEHKRTEAMLRQYAAELEARNEELDAYAHTVAHDLKNPLGHIIGYAELLEADYAHLLNETLRYCLRTIAQNGRKMNNIIDELLLLSNVRKVEEVKLATVDMGDVIVEAQKRLTDLIKRHQAQIIVSHPEAWPAALGYTPWVEEVWVNYISNAIKYGGQPPRIELGAEMQADGMARFWVRDGGPGISPENQTRLFTPFTQLGEVRAQGHGLGLSIVRRIVEKLGGQVGVESLVGEGSTFWFTLPAR